MRIALFSDVYKPVINGVVNHVSLLKNTSRTWASRSGSLFPVAATPLTTNPM
ncbi:MAG: hypothetical protein R2873_32465 [Caldilineaceae bacterium]